MQSDRLERAATIFHALADLPPENRGTLLEDECGDDSELRGFVQDLLATHDRGVGGFLERDESLLASTVPSDHSEARDLVGPYRILETLGEGGMGTVYLAEQTEPVHRQVALKVIKLGMDTKQVVARFEAERQALAMMDHPGIARVFDAGITPDGRPYFVMELVQGLPVTEFADRHALSTEQRLQLFRRVCEAVQHAHQKGIIHRDIKPSNVLVEVFDDQPVPKVIDFGIAKATGGQLTERTLFTEQGQLIGTPEYMSPEQADLAGLNIDTRTDIYSLGVLLYELLVGTLPFDRRELREAGLAEIQRILREVDPPRPSTRLDSLGPDSGVVAERRQTNRSTLMSQLRGDLDWITMKAMEKDRMRRYASISELADDVGRYLAGQAITARPPSPSYQLQKFVSRHRMAVVFTLLLVFTLAGSAVTLGVLYQSQRRERERAELEAEKSTVINEFLRDMLASANPAQSSSSDLTVREVLDRAATTIATRFPQQPGVRVALHRTIGNSYVYLWDLEAADEHLDLALDLSRQTFGATHEEVAGSLRDRGFLSSNQGDYEQAMVAYREALEMYSTLGEEESAAAATTMQYLGLLLLETGQLEEAEGLHREAVAIRRAGEARDLNLAAALNDLAITLNKQRKYEEAARLFHESLEIKQRIFGDKHSTVILARNNLASSLFWMDRFSEARGLWQEGLLVEQELFGEEHPRPTNTKNSLAHAAWAMGDHESAETLLREVLDVARREYPDHPWFAFPLVGLGRLLLETGRAQEALPLLEQALEIRKENLPTDHWQRFQSEHLVAACRAALSAADETDELEGELERAFRGVYESEDAHAINKRKAAERMISFYERQNRSDEVAKYRSLLESLH